MPITGQAAAACLGLLAVAAAISAQAPPPLPRTRAERTDFQETSRYEDVIAFIEALRATGSVRVDSFGRSEQGRDLPLLVVGTGRPVVLLMANIHAGEVEGKEALLHLARRLTTGDLAPLRDAATWLFAPIYNADGNERISVDNRTEQNGPVTGVGTRENAHGFDLNRDFMKLDTAEARALVALLTRWDPDVAVDLHTTNGSYHGYHLTYAPSLNPNADPRVIAYARERLLPTVRAAMASRHAFRTYYYGNFAAEGALAKEQPTPPPDAAWRTFDHRPRFGNNYIGLRNRIAILSEAYSYLDFAGRVRVTEAFVEEIVRFIAENAAEIRRVTTEADATPATAAGIRFKLAPAPEPVDILVGAVEKRPHPKSSRQVIAMVGQVARPVSMREYGTFIATSTRRVPPRYVMLPTADGVHRAVRDKLRAHGVRVDELTAPETLIVERFVPRAVERAGQPFQGHREVSVAGDFERASVEAPAGTLSVRTDQPLGRLVFYLLEPDSDDGMTTWNMLDAHLSVGSPHPVLKTLP